MKRAAAFAFALVGLAGCEAPTTPAPPRVPTVTEPSFALLVNDRFPFSFTVFNPCPPAEPVAISGEAHVVITGDADGQRFHLNWSRVHGVGLVTGERYTAHNNVKQEIDFPPPSFEVESMQHFRLVRQGSLDNWDLFVVFRFSSGPPPMFEVIRSRSECRG